MSGDATELLDPLTERVFREAGLGTGIRISIWALALVTLPSLQHGLSGVKVRSLVLNATPKRWRGPRIALRR